MFKFFRFQIIEFFISGVRFLLLAVVVVVMAVMVDMGMIWVVESMRAWFAGSEQPRRLQDKKSPLFPPLLILSQRYDIQ